MWSCCDSSWAMVWVNGRPKVAIVTAAGKGIGAAIANELASDGYRVSLLSNSGGALKLAQELGGIGMTGSVTELADLTRLVDSINS